MKQLVCYFVILFFASVVLLSVIACYDPFSKLYYEQVMNQSDFSQLPLSLPLGYPTDHIYTYRKGYMAQRKAPAHLDILDGKLDGLYIYPTPLKKVHVYIVDHGLDIYHPDIQGIASMPYNRCNVTHRSMEHGTQVASLVAGKMAGVAKSAKLIGVAVCSAPSKNATDRDFREALDWILNHLDHDVQNIVVVSMTADFYPDILSENMYKRFHERNTLLVFPPLSNRDPNTLTMHKDMQVASSICVGGLTENLNFLGGPTQNNSDLVMVADNFLSASCRVNSHYFGYQVSSDVTLATAIVGGIAAVFLSRQDYKINDLKKTILALGKVNSAAPHKIPILSFYYHFFSYMI